MLQRRPTCETVRCCTSPLLTNCSVPSVCRAVDRLPPAKSQCRLVRRLFGAHVVTVPHGTECGKKNVLAEKAEVRCSACRQRILYKPRREREGGASRELPASTSPVWLCAALTVVVLSCACGVGQWSRSCWHDECIHSSGLMASRKMHTSPAFVLYTLAITVSPLFTASRASKGSPS